METKPQSSNQRELRRLLGYVRPYSVVMVAGILLMALMAAADGLVLASIRPAFDIVLKPSSWNQQLDLFTLPWIHKTITLNSLVPARIHHVWSVFAVAVVFLFLVKG
ncbi:MAG: hypothetical protein WAL86_16520, partial [Candidatus Acidiferrales bacterium]